MSIKDRFKMIMDREQLTAGAFAESIEVAQATISHILASRNNPSTEVILKLHKRYNDINLEWLLTGKGNMPKEIVKQEIIYKERPPKKITEIRIFFDDNTYETFKPEN